MNKALIELEARRSIICNKMRDSQEDIEISYYKKYIEILNKIIAKVKEETMTNTPLTVDNSLGLYDGCWVKLTNGDIVGPLCWESKKALFIGRIRGGVFTAQWTADGLNTEHYNDIIAIAPTPPEPVKVPEPWTLWQNVYGDYRGELWTEKEDALTSRKEYAKHTLEIECRVTRVHFPDGTIQEVK